MYEYGIKSNCFILYKLIINQHFISYKLYHLIKTRVYRAVSLADGADWQSWTRESWTVKLGPLARVWRCWCLTLLLDQREDTGGHIRGVFNYKTKSLRRRWIACIDMHNFSIIKHLISLRNLIGCSIFQL